MANWNPSQYLKFKNQRTQPAVDLATRTLKYNPKTVADIGCGPGNSTFVLKQLFPNSDITGIDSSPEMILKAKKEYPDIKFEIGDATALSGKYDLIFSNACLQWVPDHSTLIPSLMNSLNDGGVLAVQIPMNSDEPLFKLINGISKESKWDLGNAKLQPNETLTPPEYFNILSKCSSQFDIWETKYYHSMPDHKSLVEWVKGTRLRPYLEYLSEEKGAEFENEIVKRSKALYPVTDNGSVVLGFRRFFFTAVKL